MTRDELRIWLDGQTRELCTAIASRAALRVFPLLNSELKKAKSIKTSASALILPTFWCNATAAFVARWPKVADAQNAAAAAAAADAAYVAAAADVAAYAAYAAAADAAAGVAANAATAFADAAVGVGYIYDCIKEDVTYIEAGGDVAGLSAQPLWPAIYPMPNEIKYAWVDLKSALWGLDQDWDVWTRWYEARLEGLALDKELELARISFDAQDYKDAAELNPKIKALEEALVELKQDKTAELFGITDKGEVEVQTLLEGQALDASEGQRGWYGELYSAIEEALSEGENALGPAFKRLSALSKAVPQNIEQARVPSLWSRANRLRRVLELHEAALKDEEPNFNRLGTEVAGYIEDVVGAYNNLKIGDGNLQAADDRAISPSDYDDILSRDALIDPVLKDAIASAPNTAETNQILADVELSDDDIRAQNTVMGRLEAQQNSVTKRNYFRALVKGARDIMLKAVALKSSEKLIDFFLKHKDNILTWLGDTVRGLF